MKMFPRLATVILFTLLLSNQPSRSGCISFIKEALGSIFKDRTVFQITYKKYTNIKDIPIKVIWNSKGYTTHILVGEFYEDGTFKEVGLSTDNAECHRVRNVKEWPDNYLPSVRFYCENGIIEEARKQKPLDKNELKEKFTLKTFVWDCEVQRDPTIKFRMVLNEFSNKVTPLTYLTVAGVGRLNGVSVKKIDFARFDGLVHYAEITEFKYLDSETEGLVMYRGKVKVIKKN